VNFAREEEKKSIGNMNMRSVSKQFQVLYIHGDVAYKKFDRMPDVHSIIVFPHLFIFTVDYLITKQNF
jgi:hypothetical protein